MRTGHFYRLAGLLALLLLSATDSDGQRSGGGRSPGRSITGPGSRPPSMRPPGSTKPKRPKYYSELPGGGIPKSMANRLPTRPLASYSYTGSLSRTAEWELVPIVLEGRVRTLLRATAEGSSATGGPLLLVSLAIARVHKGSGVKKGDQLTVRGWATGSQRQQFIPTIGDDVVVFLKTAQNGRCEMLSKTGIRKLSSSSTAVRRGIPDEDDW